MHSGEHQAVVLPGSTELSAQPRPLDLYLARHGQCQANADGLVADGNSPLTEQGELDALLLGWQMLALDFDGTIVSSPLQRSLETAARVRSICRIAKLITIESAFAEGNAGEATGISVAAFEAWLASGKAIPGFETDRAMHIRVQNGLDSILALREPTLLVAHNGICRMVECILAGLPPEQFRNIPSYRNGEVRHFRL